MIKKQRRDLSGLDCRATFSDCERFRYWLRWTWAPEAPTLLAVMLNPSTATEEALDPTISGLMRRARRAGFGAVEVLNLFAFRATDPAAMKREADPIGPDNDAVIARSLARLSGNDLLLVAWGKHGRHRGRDAEVWPAIVEHGGPAAMPCALAVNNDGTPKHPLYCAASIEPRPFHWTPPATGARLT